MSINVTSFLMIFLACFLAIWLNEVLKNFGFYFAQRKQNEVNKKASGTPETLVAEKTVHPYEMYLCIILCGSFFTGMSMTLQNGKK
jgi:Na+-driven multidrug efflux pump